MAEGGLVRLEMRQSEGVQGAKAHLGGAQERLQRLRARPERRRDDTQSCGRHGVGVPGCEWVAQCGWLRPDGVYSYQPHTHTRTCTHAHTHTRTHAQIYTQTHKYKCTHKRTHAQTRKHIPTQTHTRTHINAHTYIYTHTRIHTRAHAPCRARRSNAAVVPGGTEEGSHRRSTTSGDPLQRYSTSPEPCPWVWCVCGCVCGRVYVCMCVCVGGGWGRAGGGLDVSCRRFLLAGQRRSHLARSRYRARALHLGGAANDGRRAHALRGELKQSQNLVSPSRHAAAATAFAVVVTAVVVTAAAAAAAAAGGRRPGLGRDDGHDAPGVIQPQRPARRAQQLDLSWARRRERPRGRGVDDGGE